MDKRDIAKGFQSRLETLLMRSGDNRAKFAANIGVDRSALSQMLSDSSTRLPRSETLMRLARSHAVSVDWLLGLSSHEGPGAALKPALEIEEVGARDDQPILARWHAEAAGTKIRYVPSHIPDLMRTDAMIAFGADLLNARVETEIHVSQFALERNRQPDSDMEICMPRQRFDLLARGEGDFAGMNAATRREQLEQIANITQDRYPGLRLYLYDSRKVFSAPFTVFGSVRAAIYLGDAYLVFNTSEVITSLTRRFDELVRRAEIHAHQTSDYCKNLASKV